MIHYIFDVDGTLTPSRAKMDEKFSSFFFDFCTLNNVYLVTGSDKEKTIEQVGNVIYGMCKRVYNCSGNDVWERGKNVRKGTIKLPDTMWGYLNKEICESEFPVRTGGHIEERTGLVNLSIVVEMLENVLELNMWLGIIIQMKEKILRNDCQKNLQNLILMLLVKLE